MNCGVTRYPNLVCQFAYIRDGNGYAEYHRLAVETHLA